MDSENKKNRVEVMTQHAASYSVKFIEFIKIYSKFGKSLICIFEGQDEKYYSSRLDFKIGSHCWKGLNAGGRAKVLELEAVLRAHPLYSRSKYLCFIDRDYQDWYVNPNPDQIYVTPCYSIENFYATQSCFEKVLSAEFGITEFNEHANDFARCLQMFKDRLNEFNAAMYTFNCWAKAHRLMEFRDGTITKLNIQNVNFESLVNINFTKIDIKYDLTNHKSVFSDSPNVSLCETSINEASKTFSEEKLGMQFRGKQQIEFVKAMLTKLKFDRTSKKPSFFSTKGNVILNLSGNCISELSQYADTPECLHHFLDNAKSKFALY